jgi:hypothetical protein
MIMDQFGRKFSSFHTASDSSEENARFREIGMLTRALLDTEEALKRERESHQMTRSEFATSKLFRKKYESIVSSTSWRITAPLRAVFKLRKKILKLKIFN